MENSESASDRVETLPEALDPFAYFPGVASKIGGLGGSEQRSELAYGFHTNYVRCALGYCTFLVEFADFHATHGVIHLRVHMMATRPGSQAHVTTVDRMQMVDLVGRGGKAQIRFESLPGTTYALFAQVLDTTDARASAVTVTLDRPGGPHDDIELVEFEPTSFTAEGVRDSDQVSSSEAPTLALPVSQVMTASQLSEVSFAQWRKQFGPEAPDKTQAWRDAFVLQALDRYGALGSVAHGWGCTPPNTHIPAILANRGCILSVALDLAAFDDEEDSPDILLGRLPLVTGADPATRSRIDILPAASLGPEPLIGPFDFMWSMGMIESFDDLPSVARFLEASLAKLRPGGLAIHMTSIFIDAHRPSAGTHHAGILNRTQVERLSVHLLALGHSVAQLRFDLGTKPRDNLPIDPAPRPFGWIMRRR